MIRKELLFLATTLIALGVLIPATAQTQNFMRPIPLGVEGGNSAVNVDPHLSFTACL